MHSASNVSLERVASQLLVKPKEALETAQQTLNQCQQNLQTLQLTLQQSFSEGKTTLESRLQALGEPGSPSSSGSRLGDLLSAASAKNLQQVAAAAVAQVQQQEQQVANYMASGEVSTIEPVPTTDDDEPDNDFPETSGRFWGPFQVRFFDFRHFTVQFFPRLIYNHTHLCQVVNMYLFIPLNCSFTPIIVRRRWTRARRAL